MSDEHDETPGESLQHQLSLDDEAQRIGLRKATVWVRTDAAKSAEKSKKKQAQDRWRASREAAGLKQINVEATDEAQAIIKALADASQRAELHQALLKHLPDPVQHAAATLDAGGWRAWLIRWASQRR